MHDPGLRGRQPQTHGREHVCNVFAQGFDVFLGAVHEYDEIVRLCRLPGYAAWAVSVQVGGMLWWLRSA